MVSGRGSVPLGARQQLLDAVRKGVSGSPYVSAGKHEFRSEVSAQQERSHGTVQKWATHAFFGRRAAVEKRKHKRNSPGNERGETFCAHRSAAQPYPETDPCGRLTAAGRSPPD